LAKKWNNENRRKIHPVHPSLSYCRSVNVDRRWSFR